MAFLFSPNPHLKASDDTLVLAMLRASSGVDSPSCLCLVQHFHLEPPRKQWFKILSDPGGGDFFFQDTSSVVILMPSFFVFAV